MYLQSILITGGAEEDRQEKLHEILTTLGFPKLSGLEGHQNIAVIAPDDEKIAIGIDKIRDLRSWLTIKSTSSLPKVALIESAVSLTESAQNALLKTLEEPPENTFVILVASRISFLLPTVISRCQIIELSENFEKVLSQKEMAKLSQVLQWLEEGSLANGFAWAKENTDRKSAINILDQLLVGAHQRIFQGSTPQTASESQKLISTIRRLFEAKKYLSANTNVRLTLENLFVNW